MVGKKRSLSIVVIVLFILNISLALATITPINPTNNGILTLNEDISINLTNFVNSNITFSLINETSNYIGFNSNTGQTIYNLTFTNTSIKSDYYNLSINSSNSTTYQTILITNIYVDTHIPNITRITFNNTELGKRIFNNGTQTNITITIDENTTLNSVSVNSSKITNTSLNWNSTEDKWTAIIDITGTTISNTLKILVTDLAGQTDTELVPFWIDYSPPTIIANTIPTSTKAVPTTDKVIDLNISDDLNLTQYQIFLDDNNVTDNYQEQKEDHVNEVLNENVGYHNITIIAKDILNKITKYEKLFYWWYGPSSTTYLHAWTITTNNTNNLTDVWFSRIVGVSYIRINSALLPGAALCQNDPCAVSINNTNNYIEYNIPAGNFIEFNWNKTPLISFDNSTTKTRQIITQLQNNYTTTIKSLIYVNDKQNKTEFIRNQNFYYGIMTFKGNFSNTSEFTDMFYIADPTDLTNKVRLNQTDKCPATEYNYSINNACYTVIGNTTKVYVPKIGLLTANLDNIAPKISLNYPTGTHTDSINLNINFTTTEESVCNATISQGNTTIEYLTMTNFSSSTVDTNFYTTFANKYFKNGDYNLTINCKDLYQNINSTNYSFSVYDTTKPTITIINPENKQYKTTNDNSYTVPISISTNELASKIYYTIGSGSDWVLIGENTTTASATVRKATGSFLFRTYVIDYANNGQEKSTSFSVSATISSSTDTTSSTSKSTGIIVSDLTNLTTTKTKSQTWYSIDINETKTMLLDNPYFDFTKIEFTPTKDVSLLKITVKLIDEPPIKLPDELIEYQTYDISELATNYSVENPEITFRIKNKWIAENNIENVTVALYTDKWNKELPIKLGSDITYTTYKLNLQELPEYLVLSGVQFQPIVEKPTITNITINETKPEKNTTIIKDISEEVEEKKSPIGKIIASILIIAGLFGAGLYSYKTIKIPVLKYEDLTKTEKIKLKEFISIRLSTGEPIHKIETELINKGWSQDIVTKIIKTVNIPRKKEDELREFIEKMLKLHNISKSDLQESLINVGWQPEIIDDILKEY